MIHYIEHQRGYVRPCLRRDRHLACLVRTTIAISALVALYTLLTTYLGV